MNIKNLVGRHLSIPRPCLWQLRTPKIGICGIKSGKSEWGRVFCEKSGYPDKIGISGRSIEGLFALRLAHI